MKDPSLSNVSVPNMTISNEVILSSQFSSDDNPFAEYMWMENEEEFNRQTQGDDTNQLKLIHSLVFIPRGSERHIDIERHAENHEVTAVREQEEQTQLMRVQFIDSRLRRACVRACVSVFVVTDLRVEEELWEEEFIERCFQEMLEEEEQWEWFIPSRDLPSQTITQLQEQIGLMVLDTDEDEDADLDVVMNSSLNPNAKEFTPGIQKHVM
ncbi:hypothetical protein INR49_031500 [Caranx melampygus]|nr:hypothetical protein INR49_031500 [Caranx melampygus]